MKYKKLGRTGLLVSEVCLGTMTFGEQLDEEESVKIVKNAITEGVNFIDTANGYVAGKSEEIIGRALKNDRHSVINLYLSELTCKNGKNAYYRAIRAFCNWLYRQGYIKDNPITKVDPPKMTRIILPSLTSEQVAYLIEQADNIRDKCIISLFADSGIRLNELLNIKSAHIDWETNTVMIWGKGGKQRKAPFTTRTTELLRQVIMSANGHSNIWGMRRRGIQIMLYRLQEKTGLPCNPHTFRRTFASNLHRSGLDVEHIMRLGGWESLDMVLRYTRSVKFEESLKLYTKINLNPSGYQLNKHRVFVKSGL